MTLPAELGRGCSDRPEVCRFVPSGEPFRENGFGLIEVVVSMFILALLALALLPLLVQGVRQSAATATSATGIQLLNEQVELIRAADPRCGAVASMTSAPITDSRGVRLQVARITEACDDPYPRTVSVTATVTRLDTGATVARATTLVFVNGD